MCYEHTDSTWKRKLFLGSNLAHPLFHFFMLCHYKTFLRSSMCVRLRQAICQIRCGPSFDVMTYNQASLEETKGCCVIFGLDYWAWESYRAMTMDTFLHVEYFFHANIVKGCHIKNSIEFNWPTRNRIMNYNVLRTKRAMKFKTTTVPVMSRAATTNR